jgi:hypothetical protein
MISESSCCKGRCPYTPLGYQTYLGQKQVPAVFSALLLPVSRQDINLQRCLLPFTKEGKFGHSGWASPAWGQHQRNWHNFTSWSVPAMNFPYCPFLLWWKVLSEQELWATLWNLFYPGCSPCANKVYMLITGVFFFH